MLTSLIYPLQGDNFGGLAVNAGQYAELSFASFIA